MPFSGVKDAESSVPSIKNMSSSAKKRFVKIFNAMEKEGVAEDVAIPTAIKEAKSMKKASQELNKALEQVRITMSFEEMLRKFFGLYYSDSEVLAKLMGFETEEEYYLRMSEENEDSFPQSHQEYLEEKIDKFELLRSAVITNDFSGITEEIESSFRQMISKSTEKLATPIIKTADELLKEVTFVYYEPDVLDCHGQYANKQTIEKGCENFNENLEKGNIRPNLFHSKDKETGVYSSTESFEIQKSWINPADCEMGGQSVTEGTWLVKIKILNDTLWDMFLSGEVRGVSMGALGEVREPGE